MVGSLISFVLIYSEISVLIFSNFLHFTIDKQSLFQLCLEPTCFHLLKKIAPTIPWNCESMGLDGEYLNICKNKWL